MTSKKRLFLIDGMAQLYRSHFAMINNPLITKDGRHTSAIFGFMNILFKLIREENPDYLAVILDSKEPTFRHKLYTEYKATREKMPDELVEQLEPLFDVLNIANIPMVKKPGYEADDIIGTLAKQAEENGLQTFMVTGDKDMMQLITDNVFMLAPGTRFRPTTIYNREGVIEKWGIPPEKIIDLLALMGDSSDNIPGIEGVGPKTATKLLKEYGDMESVLDHSDEVKNKRVKAGLENGREIAHLSKELVTIDLDVPVELHINELKRQPMNEVELAKKFEDLEIYSLIKQISSVSEDSPVETIDVKKQYSTVMNIEQLKQMISEIEKADIVSFDLETTSIYALQANIVGLSFSIKPDYGWYIPVEYPEKPQELFSNFGLNEILNELNSILENPKIKKCGQNLKYDALVLSRYDIQLNGIEFDTMIASHLLHPEYSSYKLDSLSAEYLKYRMVPIADLIGSGSKQKSMAEVPLKDISFYASEDADVALQLTQIMQKKVDTENLHEAFYKIEMPLLPVMIEMERNGVFVDCDYLKKLSESLGDKIEVLVRDIHKLAGTEFNVNSPQQLANILFDILELKPVRKRSTDVNVLKVLKNHHPLPEQVLKYRHLKKLKSTYIDAFPELVNPKTNRIHSSFNQTIASTGRLSSTHPNFQNIPIRTEIGKEIRKAFIPQNEDCVLLSADYSQVELRVMAHLSKEPALLKAFENDEDIHSKTASLVYGISQDEVTPEQRRTAKIVNFGIMYGAGPYRMSQELGIEMYGARELINTYFNTYPGIRAYINQTLLEARETGFVTTLGGRKRNAKRLFSDRAQEVQAEERAIVNMPIQGTAAELIKLAMIRIHKKLQEMNYKTKMILQVHDELLFEVPKTELDEITKIVVNEMENAMSLDVPLKVDYGIGRSWYEAH